MKKLHVVCLAALAVSAIQSSAEAGRRATRRAARRAAPVVAAAAVAPRSTTVVAAAAAAPVAARSGYAAALPDLTITDLRSDRGVLLITVKNVGRAPSPLTRLAVELRHPGNGLLIGAHASRVLPLAVNQSVQISIHSAPLEDVRVGCIADPLGEVAEMNELNNGRAMLLAPLPAVPPILQDDAEWQQPAGQESEPIALGEPS
jgi:hypothetical protein